MTDSPRNKDIQKLQRAIVDGLEDVKAQDIRVFNTAHLSPLFERVIVASGTSNRQTKALAASVRDKVREAGFPKPRTEGEENGEWIIVDCGAAVAHVMQPSIRQYYNLEEIWGDKPVRLKVGAPKPVAPAKTPARTSGPVADAPTAPARKGAAAARRAVATGADTPSAPAKKAASRKAAGAASAAPAQRSPSRTAGSGTASAKAAAPRASAATRKVVAKVVVGAPKAPAKKAAAAKVPAKSAARQAPARKAAGKA